MADGTLPTLAAVMKGWSSCHEAFDWKHRNKNEGLSHIDFFRVELRRTPENIAESTATPRTWPNSEVWAEIIMRTFRVHLKQTRPTTPLNFMLLEFAQLLASSVYDSACPRV